MRKSILIFATNPQDIRLKAEIELTLGEWDALLEKAPSDAPWDKLKMEFESAKQKVSDLVKEIS